MAQSGNQVRLNFSFEGVAENGELTLNEGDVVTLTSIDVGEGWYEGRSESGQVGLFPISYCDMIENGAPVAAAESYPTYASEQHQDTVDGGEDDDWDADWQTSYQPQQQQTAASQPPQTLAPAYEDRKPSITSEQSAITTTDDASPKKTGSAKGGLFGKNIFSSFTSSPASTFVAGECKVDVSSVPKIMMDMSEDGPYWVSTESPINCSVSNPTKASKFSGLKSYIAYNITPGNGGQTVARRYKHFDWLYEQLSRKYGCTLAVPPLPDKQITGRYEEEFIETRRRQLENWLTRMCYHPIIISSEVFQHFLHCKDNEKAWKSGKRKAEHDPAVGAALYMTLEVPPMQRLDLAVEDKRNESYGKFIRTFDESMKQTLQLGSENIKNCGGSLMKDNQKLGQQFKQMGMAFAMDERPIAQPLTDAMQQAGKTYEEIAVLYQNQPQYDWIPFLDGLHDYHGQVSCYQGILANGKSALDKQKDMTKQQIEGKVTLDEVDKATNRAETVCFAIQSEVNNLQHYRVGDFATYMKNFLEQQRRFHLELAAKIEESLNAFNSLTTS